LLTDFGFEPNLNRKPQIYSLRLIVDPSDLTPINPFSYLIRSNHDSPFSIQTGELGYLGNSGPIDQRPFPLQLGLLKHYTIMSLHGGT
jgi:hypothetical protein